jgi:hypothetical protein
MKPTLPIAVLLFLLHAVPCAAARPQGAGSALRPTGPAETGDTLHAQGVISLREELIEARKRILRGLNPNRLYILLSQYRALAEISEALGEYETAERWYDRILSHYSFDIPTLIRISDMHLTRPDPRPARADSFLSMAEMAADRIPDTVPAARVRFARARYLTAIGDPEAAWNQLVRARTIWGDDAPDALLRDMARLARQRGDLERGLELYGEILGRTRGLDQEARRGLVELLEGIPEQERPDPERVVADAIARRREREREKAAAMGGRVIRFASGDGVPLTATLFARDDSARTDSGTAPAADRPALDSTSARTTIGTGANAAPPPAVLLLPPPGGDRSDWNDLAVYLHRGGFEVLTLDPRGVGASRTERDPDARILRDSTATLWQRDVRAATTLLVDTGPSKRVVVGASGEGAVPAVLASHRDGRVVGLLLVSPLFGEHRAEVISSLQFHPDRPVHCLGSYEDLLSLHAIYDIQKLPDRSARTKQLYDGAGHGIEILERVPDSMGRIAAWLATLRYSP